MVYHNADLPQLSCSLNPCSARKHLSRLLSAWIESSRHTAHAHTRAHALKCITFETGFCKHTMEVMSTERTSRHLSQAGDPTSVKHADLIRAEAGHVYVTRVSSLIIIFYHPQSIWSLADFISIPTFIHNGLETRTVSRCAIPSARPELMLTLLKSKRCTTQKSFHDFSVIFARLNLLSRQSLWVT